MGPSGSEGWFISSVGEGWRKRIEDVEGDGAKSHKKELDVLSALWFFLPAEVNENIIRKIPLEDLLRWRLVCKNWNRLIMSRSGTHCSARFTNNLPLIVRSDIFSPASLSTFSEKVGKWCRMDTKFLFPVLHSEVLERTLIECRYLTGGRVGLLFMLCIFSLAENAQNMSIESRVIICNPLTKESTEVKIPDERRGAHVWVICDEQQHHYKFLVTYKHDSLHRVYDSRSGSWKQVTGPVVDPHCIFSAVSNKGCLYFLRRPPHLQHHICPAVGVYDPSSNSWTEMHGVPNHIGPDKPRLVEAQGQLLYVARTFIPDEKLGRMSWCFYKMVSLDPAGLLNVNSSSRSKLVEWERVREMPSDLYWKLNHSIISSMYKEIRCIGEGNNIFFVALECTCKQDRGKRLTNKGVNLFVLAYNFQQDSWTWLPAYADSEARFWHWETNSIRLISFQPSLAAVGRQNSTSHLETLSFE